VESNGGAVWCMAVNHSQTLLAAGCQDGCVRLFNIADGLLEYVKTLDKQDGIFFLFFFPHILLSSLYL